MPAVSLQGTELPSEGSTPIVEEEGQMAKTVADGLWEMLVSAGSGGVTASWAMRCLVFSLWHWAIGQHGVWGGLVAAERAAMRRRTHNGPAASARNVSPARRELR